MSVCPAKTHISLGTRPVWSESSLFAQWVAKDPSFLHVDSEDSDQTGQMPRMIWVFAGCTLILLVLSCHGSYIFGHSELTCSLPLVNNTYIRKYQRFSCISRHDFPLDWPGQGNMSRNMTKPTKWLCAQQRLRSAWASAKSDQSLRCALNR